MISVEKFFRMNTRELETYLYDKFPLAVGINAGWEEYLGIIKATLGVNIVFHIGWLKEYSRNKIIKKNEVFFEGGYLGAEYILMYQQVYESSIYINNIYSSEPLIRKVEGKWENKQGKNQSNPIYFFYEQAAMISASVNAPSAVALVSITLSLVTIPVVITPEAVVVATGI